MTLFTFCSVSSRSLFPKVSNSMFLIERTFVGNVRNKLMYVSRCVVKVEYMHLSLVIAQ